MKEQFQTFNFRKDTIDIINQANEIIEDYQEQGFDLTLRQLYYQFVARDLIPNSQKSYDRLGSIINDARLNGDIDWDAIKDRTRSIQGNPHWGDPSSVIYSAMRSYRIDTRKGQKTMLEVWVEKEALVGVVAKAAKELDIDYFACRGYVSQTAMYEASKRFKYLEAEEAVILHLGDHDPSGIDMTRDISDRLNTTFGVPTTIKRIALNMNQVQQYAPPPNPAKMTDSRCGEYVQKYGSMSWELDALEPKVLINLIKTEALQFTEVMKQKDLRERQEREREQLENVSNRWYEVIEFLGEEND